MYGVPADLNLTFLCGAELIQICLGQYQLQFHFQPVGYFAVEGKWELRNAAGEVIDGLHDGPDRPPYQLHRLLGCRVTETTLSPPDWLALKFENGHELRIFDDSTNYESFQMDPGCIIV